MLPPRQRWSKRANFYTCKGLRPVHPRFACSSESFSVKSPLLRTFLERFSRGRVLKRRLPGDFRRLPIYVSPEAGLRYWLSMRNADPVLYRMCNELVKPDACVWDIGANVGLFSFCAASRSGKNGYVLAVEPDIWLAHLIRKSAQLWLDSDYDAAKVTVLCAAVSNAHQIKSLHIAERSRSANYLDDAIGSTQSGGSRSDQLSLSIELDFLLKYFRPPSVLKIDVETHEVQVLEGASELLRRHRPVIWCEVSSQNCAEVFDLLTSANYQLFNSETKERLLAGRANWNTLALPA